MDVLAPDLLWVDDRCYRLPVLHSSNYNEDRRQVQTNEGVDIESFSDCDEKNYDKTCDFEGLIETVSDNRYKLTLSIPQTFWSKIIGTKGVTKKRIESDTKTTIIIPKQMENKADIVIKGSSKRNIILAKKNIDAVVSSTRQKLVFTHFISVPMNGDEIKQNFLDFKDKILNLFGRDRGIDDSIFQNSNKLHLTLGTLVLADQNERCLAEKVLNEVYEKSIRLLVDSSRTSLIEMKGIEYMNDDPAEVDVLYAKINTKPDEELLQKIADKIMQHFSNHNLVKSDSMEKVKLHVTLMNTLFREELEELDENTNLPHRNKFIKKTRRTFNAVNILQKCHDFYFGQQELNTIHLSVRFTSDKNGYYKSSCILNF